MVYFLLLGVIFLWAGNFPTSKFTLGIVSPLTLITMRTVVGTIVLLLIGRKSTPNWWEVLFEDLKSTLVLATTGVVASGILFYLGLRLTTASNAGIIAASTPIWVTLLSWIFLAERLTLASVAGIILSFAGLLVIICQGALENLLNTSFSWGDLLILCGQLNWATYTVYGRVVLARRSPTAATASAYLVGSVMLLPLALTTSSLSLPPRLPLLAVVSVGYLCLLSPLTNLLYYKALATISPHRAAVFMNLIPIIVLLFSALFLGERVSRFHMVGTAMVISGVLLTTRTANSRG